MVRQIGLMDYDVLRTKYYVAPNYDLGLVYAYLKGDRNLNVRLISSPSPTNLAQYDKIYIFKQSIVLALEKELGLEEKTLPWEINKSVLTNFPPRYTVAFFNVKSIPFSYFAEKKALLKQGL